jgi:hypothetical protein
MLSSLVRTIWQRGANEANGSGLLCLGRLERLERLGQDAENSEA